ncbi:FitA-like ribbon-helix-helix domain-containing protein [Thalassospira xiamenensis]|uniref:Plasmid stability protein stbC n=1 Tax=Thalassospira xiamenensis TaxID=220697 RepID=A0A367XDD6_9PROT|nr:Arc family DNA-binding protein [Thalassospira xiamenensis]KZB53034.1 plasmid stability protein stbC [Thalassospira xiamenensis]RCK50652.1 plasmid stability protein stbC [Thalassospira xiamenensis]
MPSITIRNVPDEVHRAIRVRAAMHGRSAQAELRDILDKAAKPEGRLKLGSLLASIAREAGGLIDDEAEGINQIRDKTSAEPMRFE